MAERVPEPVSKALTELVTFIADENSATQIFRIKDLIHNRRILGDWEISVRKI
ncbi:MAG: hypothetical protein J0H17_10440 [Rhizobiales bacterium]|nr:hypothetical protein [Hyphomicrobiales bacterium]